MGEYRQGTVEMMNSPYVVVAYLKSDKDMTFDFGSWNNKRWRSLFIVHPSVIISVRPYPYYSESLEEICLNWLRDLASPIDGYGPYAATKQELRNEHNINHCETGELIYVDIETNFMYNDLQYSHACYLAYGLSRLYFNYSGEAECMICGDEIEYDEDFDECVRPSALCCRDCMTYTECPRCGRRMYGEGSWDEVEDQFVCYDCREVDARYCPWDESYYWTENVVDLYVKANDIYVEGVYPMALPKHIAVSAPADFIKKFGEVHYDTALARYYINAEAFDEWWNNYFGVWYRGLAYKTIEEARLVSAIVSTPKVEEFWNDLPF
jgi:hypothetical protein